MKRTILAALACLALAGCATPQDYSAARDIHAFLISIRDGDRAAFEQHVDRQALRLQLEGRLIKELPDDPLLKSIGIFLSRPVAGAATDVLVKPSVFRTVAIYNGYDPARPLPRSSLIAQAIRSAGAGRVCIGDKDDPCTLVFTREGDVWRLTAFDGNLRDLRLS